MSKLTVNLVGKKFAIYFLSLQYLWNWVNNYNISSFSSGSENRDRLPYFIWLTTLSMIVWSSTRLRHLIDIWTKFQSNRQLLREKENLSMFKDEGIYYFRDVRRIPVFKKCNFSINQYYWSVKTVMRKRPSITF